METLCDANADEGDFKAKYFGYTEATNAMQNGQLDAVNLTGGIPTSSVTELLSGSMKVKIMPFTRQEYKKLHAAAPALVPPVALTSYTAAGISGANPTDVVFSAFKLSSAGLMIPFLFVYSPMLLMQDFILGVLITGIITGLIGLYFFASAIEGYFK